MNASPSDEDVWTWSGPGRRPDHLHARWDRGELVVIIRGGAAGSIGAGQGGVRLPAEAASGLAAFVGKAG